LRAHIWQITDPSRCSLPESFFADDFSFETYVDYALQVPMFFLTREGKSFGNLNFTFAEYLANGYKDLIPNYNDWLLHLTTLFPEVRMKNFLEVRSCDRQSGTLSFAYPALLKILFYHQETFAAVSDLVSELNHKDCVAGIVGATKDALQGSLAGKPLLFWAQELLAVIRSGLNAMKQEKEVSDFEERSFAELEELILERGKCPADLQIEAINQGKSIRYVVESHVISVCK